MVLFLAHFKLNVSLAITFHFSSSIQLVQHMLILVVPYVLLGRNWAKRGLSVPSPKKITLACVACLCFLLLFMGKS